MLPLPLLSDPRRPSLAGDLSLELISSPARVHKLRAEDITLQQIIFLSPDGTLNRGEKCIAGGCCMALAAAIIGVGGKRASLAAAAT